MIGTLPMLNLSAGLTGRTVARASRVYLVDRGHFVFPEPPYKSNSARDKTTQSLFKDLIYWPAHFLNMFFSWTALLTLLTVAIHGAWSIPVNETVWNSFDNNAREILARATPAAPHFVVYDDAGAGVIGPPPASQIKVRLSPAIIKDYL
jgi:hypothetical protein